jgi:lipooligosaccharide transport system permease protein
VSAVGELGARLGRPPGGGGSPIAAIRDLRAWHLIERNLFVYRRTWTIIVSGFFEPLFYLGGIGYGLGRLVGDVTGPGGQPIPYAMFVAPALLATGAMNGAVSEATFNFFFKLNYNRTFQSILATPVTVIDVAIGELAWALIRGGLYAIGFLGVLWALGVLASPLAILALPASLLLGFAVGAVGMAATSFMRSPQDFALINVVIMPMFLFSATFFPIETYPEAVRGIVAWTPLYQGVALIRGLTVGVVGPEMLFHVAYLLVMGGIGLWITSRRLDRVLLK